MNITENGRYTSPEYNLHHRMHYFLFETESDNLYPVQMNYGNVKLEKAK
jgi:hypothetical protein